jgi:hypothetical protein
MQYTITITDTDLPAIQTALDRRNAVLRNNGEVEIPDIGTYLQECIEKQFNLAPQLEREERRVKIQSILETIHATPTYRLDTVSEGIAIAVSKVDVEPVEGGGIVKGGGLREEASLP